MWYSNYRKLITDCTVSPNAVSQAAVICFSSLRSSHGCVCLCMCRCRTTPRCLSDVTTPGLHLSAHRSAAVSSLLPPVLSELAAPQVKVNPHALTSTRHQAFMTTAAKWKYTMFAFAAHFKQLIYLFGFHSVMWCFKILHHEIRDLKHTESRNESLGQNRFLSPSSRKSTRHSDWTHNSVAHVWLFYECGLYPRMHQILRHLLSILRFWCGFSTTQCYICG